MLATWLELSEDEQKNYDTVKEKIIESLMPTEFVTLEQFHSRKLLPGESLSVFLHELRKLLAHSMLKVESSMRDQLFLHQFISGLPISIAKQLRATGEVKDINDSIQRARLLLSLEEHEKHSTAAVQPRITDVEQRLSKQIESLAEQVAALATRQETTEHGT